jgi:Flp pilus assembly protein TadD
VWRLFVGLGMVFCLSGAMAQENADRAVPTSDDHAADAQGAAGTTASGQGGALRASDPRSVATAFEQASRLHHEGRAVDALAALDVALHSNPRDPQLRFLYGVILSEQGRGSDAAAVFEQLTQDFPELPEPYNNLAVLLGAKGDLDGARRALENAVRALPDYTVAYENLGDVYLRMAARSWERAGRSIRGGETARAKLTMARDMLDRLPQPPAPRVRGGGRTSTDSASPSSAPTPAATEQ